MAVGVSRVVEVMETTNLPQLHKEWTVEDTHKAKKMIASIIYKYIRDEMFNEMTAMHVIVDKFKVKQTTIPQTVVQKEISGRRPDIGTDESAYDYSTRRSVENQCKDEGY